MLERALDHSIGVACVWTSQSRHQLLLPFFGVGEVLVEHIESSLLSLCGVGETASTPWYICSVSLDFPETFERCLLFL